ncbi:MAG: hypothetical protein M1824_002229 [Vezdaea acicularis]|nr:MAG: hypothetical protein M1824_002229 [Vezdaea acicularis]
MPGPDDLEFPGVVRGQNFPGIPDVLPHEKVFPIQIGSELFRLSGASISSDAPSYFSQFFVRELQQNEGNGSVRTLYIDRDPVTFRDISIHLQGYYVQPRDSIHFVRLFADAQFYGLPRLISQLFEAEIFIEIGHKLFQIPRNIFSSPGDEPNYFSLGFGHFFSTPNDVFPGLEKTGLLRPPPVVPPSVPGRSGDVFSDLIYLLRGYPLHVRDDEHREALLRDCRYFHLRGLEQKLIRHNITFNLKRSRTEITLRLEDVRQSGISFTPDSSPSMGDPGAFASPQGGGWVSYSRPFVDETSHELVLEIGGESTRVDLRSMRADFHGQTKARVASLFQVVANKMNLPTTQPLGLIMMSGGANSQPPSPANTPLSEDMVRIRLTSEAHILVDGDAYYTTDRSDGAGESLDGEYEDQTMTGGAGPWSASGGLGGNSFISGGDGTNRAATPSSRSLAGSSPGTNPPAQQQQGATPIPRIDTSRPPPKKRKRRGSNGSEETEWIVRRGLWRLRVQPSSGARGGMEMVMVAVKLDALTGEFARNAKRDFLT